MTDIIITSGLHYICKKEKLRSILLMTQRQTLTLALIADIICWTSLIYLIIS